MKQLKASEAPKISVEYDGGFLWPGELGFIAGLLRDVSPRRVVEMGVHTGGTAAQLLRLVPSIQEYIGIDVPANYVTPLEVQRGEVPTAPGFMVVGNPKFRMIIRERGSYDVSPTELGTVDAMFIDGDHSYSGVSNDTELAVQCVRAGGVIIWHDYYPGSDALGGYEIFGRVGG